MSAREQLVADLNAVAVYFRQRMDGASKDSQNRYWRFAEICQAAAQSVYSDGETIKEYEQFVDRIEQGGRKDVSGTD